MYNRRSVPSNEPPVGATAESLPRTQSQTTPSGVYEGRPFRRRLVRMLLLTALLFTVGVIVALKEASDFAYGGVAFPVDLYNGFHVPALQQAVVSLATAMTADDVCVTCPEVGVALQCIMWNNGTLWLNPVVLSESREESTGFERSSMDNGAKPKRVRRPSVVLVRFNGSSQAEVTGVEAHCIGHAIELFDGALWVRNTP
jgi:peptide deformylase